MSPSSESAGSRMLDGSLVAGGAGLLAVAVYALAQGRPPLAPRFSILFLALFLLNLGLGNLLHGSHPVLSVRLQTTGKIMAGLALFAFSWALSHR